LILEPALVRRELVVEVLRTKRAFFLVLLAVLFSSGVALLAWPRRLQPVGMGIENVVSVLLFLETQLTAAILIIPAFTAGAIAGERERGTYEVLHSSLLSPRAIVLSKALAPTAFVIILLAAAAPMACSLYLVGGVAFRSFIQAYAVTLSSIVLSGLICLHASMLSGRTAGAVVRGMAGIILWNGGLFFVAVLVTGLLYHVETTPPSWFPLLFFLSPHAAMAVGIVGVGRFGAGTFTFDPWLGSVVYSSVLSAIYLALILIPVHGSEVRPSGGRFHSLSRGRLGLKRRSLLTRLLSRLGETGRPWNPVFLKEIRSEFFGRGVYRTCTFWGPLLLFAWIAAEAGDWGRSMHMIYKGALLLGVLIVPAIGASAVPREIEQGNIDFLRGTLLGLRAVFRGKLLAALYAVSGIVLAAFFSCLPALFSVPGPFLHSVGVLVVALFTTASISLSVSAFSRKTLTALVGSYGLVLLWLAGWPILLFLLRSDWSVLAASNPFGALDSLREPSFGRSSPFGSILGFHLIHIGASIILVVWGGSRLETSRSRDP
jgi:ABC-type transport system involved in multi-copper enzyme maturation permease subunit